MSGVLTGLCLVMDSPNETPPPAEPLTNRFIDPHFWNVLFYGKYAFTSSSDAFAKIGQAMLT